MAGASCAVLCGLLAACGGASSGTASHPVQSASAACRDFGNWFLAQNGNVLAGKDPALLQKAVSEAPSGHLYRDMSAFRSDVLTASGAADKLLVLVAAQSVQADCQSVNPG